MSEFEYKVVTAPRKVRKVKGVRGTDARYAVNMTDLMNEQAADGWEYQRAESLPVDEKTGLMGKTQERYVNVLVFRRSKPAEKPADVTEPVAAQPATAPVADTGEPAPEPHAAIEPPLETGEPAADPKMLDTPAIDDAPAAEVPPLGAATRD